VYQVNPGLSNRLKGVDHVKLLVRAELDYYIRLGKSLLTMDPSLIEAGLEKQIFFEVGEK